MGATPMDINPMIDYADTLLIGAVIENETNAISHIFKYDWSMKRINELKNSLCFRDSASFCTLGNFLASMINATVKSIAVPSAIAAKK